MNIQERLDCFHPETAQERQLREKHEEDLSKIEKVINYYRNSNDEVCYFSKIQRVLRVGYEEALYIRDELIKIGLVEPENYKINRSND
jgi:hypothetical protein